MVDCNEDPTYDGVSVVLGTTPGATRLMALCTTWEHTAAKLVERCFVSAGKNDEGIETHT